MSVILYESRDHIARITINRPAARNALNNELVGALNAAWKRFEQEDDRVAVLGASGEQAFCVGADLKDLPECQQQKAAQIVEPGRIVTSETRPSYSWSTTQQ